MNHAGPWRRSGPSGRAAPSGAAGRPLRVLVFSTLYPSSSRPQHGIFVETRLREWLKSGSAEARVVAPVPWFPLRGERWGEHAAMARTPHREQRGGVDVLHPRYLVVPRVGMHVAPRLLALGAAAAVRRLQREGFDFDLIDAHYFYPDGVAAALLARHFGKPLVITARGSDVNLIADFPGPRRMMLRAAAQAQALVGVSAALVERMRALGMPAEKLHVFRNGVDLERFRPPTPARAALGVGGLGGLSGVDGPDGPDGASGAPRLLSVGNLVENKGHALCIDALAAMLPTHPGATLAIVGQGPERERLQRHAVQQGVGDRVRFAGSVPQADLPRWYAAADVLLLASSREGWPNVLLEAMACGTPVVATRVGGVPEIVTAEAVGRLVDVRTGAAFADAVRALLAASPDRERVRRHAEGHGWRVTSQAQLALFSRLAAAAPDCVGAPRHA